MQRGSGKAVARPEGGVALVGNAVRVAANASGETNLEMCIGSVRNCKISNVCKSMDSEVCAECVLLARQP